MNIDLDSLDYVDLPEYLQQTEEIMCWLKSKSHEELKKLWGCNEKIVEQNFERLAHMDLQKQLTPAVLSYEGLAYQYMAPAVFEYGQSEYVQEHLRILSVFYGVLKPMDGVIINLASKEYSRCVEKYLTDRDTYITVTFCEKSGNKLVTKGTYAKMARGEMVRFMAEKQIEDPVEMKNFDRLGYVYREDLSTDREYVFERRDTETQ